MRSLIPATTSTVLLMVSLLLLLLVGVLSPANSKGGPFPIPPYISSLATDHLLVPKLMTALRDADMGHIRVIVGGIVPNEDETELIAAGVSRVFHPGTLRDEIVGEVSRLAAEARAAGA